MICKTDGCENYTEGTTDFCASCNHALRKLARDLSKVKVVKPIRKVSAKKMTETRIYKARRKHFLKAHPNCQIKLDVCTGKATQIHHAAGRIGSNYTNKNTFVATCDGCHRKLHDVLSAKERREKGFLI